MMETHEESSLSASLLELGRGTLQEYAELVKLSSAVEAPSTLPEFYAPKPAPLTLSMAR
ncbi:hypothetical protein [Arthrobacter sp. MMS18-M83]|uniref:hypothetical protein n=1 Tax=Arthrobacter sp. MMS18-M83 TaxID=2996261 RepID=UPI00227B1170|nr:hypothetical protein [Arthrobacter sp. MMS18-M83]WAH96176.1 hypothetical protein OW521_17365 [Arthrobacter sp. MMS18-M83]